jgi:hypothetical protein
MKANDQTTRKELTAQVKKGIKSGELLTIQPRALLSEKR